MVDQIIILKSQYQNYILSPLAPYFIGYTSGPYTHIHTHTYSHTHTHSHQYNIIGAWSINYQLGILNPLFRVTGMMGLSVQEEEANIRSTPYLHTYAVGHRTLT